jgi:hypothetical protein
VQARFLIDWGRIGRDQNIAASRDSFKTGDNSPMAALIRGCICEL